jgi:hypothetical protein
MKFSAVSEPKAFFLSCPQTFSICLVLSQMNPVYKCPSNVFSVSSLLFLILPFRKLGKILLRGIHRLNVLRQKPDFAFCSQH